LLKENAVPTKFCFTKEVKRRRVSEKKSLKQKDEINEIIQSINSEQSTPNTSYDSHFDQGFNQVSFSEFSLPVKVDKTTQMEETVRVKSVKTQCDSGICQQPVSPTLKVKIGKRTPFLTRTKGCNTELSFDPDIEVSFSVNCIKLSSIPIKEHPDPEDLTDSS